MAEITYQMVLSTLQTVGLLVGIFYYVTTLRNAQKTRELALKNQELTLQSQELSRKAQEQSLETRETQLFMDIYKTAASKDFMLYLEDILLIWEFTGYEDFYDKYGADVDPEDHAKFDYILQYYNGIGLLVKRGLIDPELVYHLMRFSIISFWEKFKVVVEGDRERFNLPTMYQDVEHLSNLLKEYRTKEINELMQ